MTALAQLRRFVIGPPKDARQPGVLHRLALVPLLAWVGLGADGLSSSAYGPEETFRQLGEHRGLAVFLAAAMVLTVAVISYGYSRIIEQFPAGGGGYVVVTKVLGGAAGACAGSALLVDYVLTITISIAAFVDAVFSALPPSTRGLALPLAIASLGLLVVMNLRGVRESVTLVLPVFVLFLVTHAVLLLVGLGAHLFELPRVAAEVRTSVRSSVSALGLLGAAKIAAKAFALGGGTYTGIEAISNGVAIMREPRVETAKKTMLLMAVSLAVTASGLLVCFLLWDVRPVEGQTMNAVLLHAVADGWTLGGAHVGRGFVVTALLAEGALLLVAAQTGFVDGPRVMANMAVDSFLPHRFSALSERLTMRNGIVLMGGAALVSLLYTHGDVGKLVVMYAINVFVTFTLSNAAMAVFWIRRRRQQRDWARHLPAHVLAALLSAFILLVTVSNKLLDGGWLTLLVTAVLVALCFSVRRHYRLVGRAIGRMDAALPPPELGSASEWASLAPLTIDPAGPVAILLVGGYSGLGRHALLTLLRMFPGHFSSVVFVSVAVVDSDVFKGVRELPALEARTRASLDRYEQFGRSLGLGCDSRLAVGTEVVAESERLVRELVARYPKALVVAGQLVFEHDTTWHRVLHNETAFAIQRKLQRDGVAMVVLPVRLALEQAA